MKSDLSKIINGAYRITFGNKWLWVFGLVLALFSGGGNFNFPSSSRGNLSKEDSFRKELMKKDPQYYKDVLGSAAISAESLVKSIPVYTYLFFGVFAFVMILLGLGIALYAKSWANASLIEGINLESNGTKMQLSQASLKGRSKAIEMAKLNVIPGLALLFLALLAFIPGFILMAFGSLGILFGILWFVTLGLGFLVLMLLVSASVSLGSISLVLENLNYSEAFKKGFTIFKGYFVDVVILGLVNCLTTGLVSIASCVVIIPLVLVGALGFAGVAAIPYLAVALIPVGALLLIAVIAALTLVKAIMIVFQESTWVLLYKQLTSQNTIR